MKDKEYDYNYNKTDSHFITKRLKGLIKKFKKSTYKIKVRILIEKKRNP